MKSHTVQLFGGPNDGARVTLPSDISEMGIPVDVPASKLALIGPNTPELTAAIMRKATIFDVYSWNETEKVMKYIGRRAERKKQ